MIVLHNHKEFITHYAAKSQAHDLTKFGVLEYSEW